MTTGHDAPFRRLHFAGVAGSGMSALAQYHLLAGGAASGSDRSFDRADPDPAALEIRRKLEALGLELSPQDGSALARSPLPDAVIVSTAVEGTVPDVQAARSRQVPVLHRSELLARWVEERRTIAVTGTSGKSTVTAMVFEILAHAALDPSILTGGDLLALRARGLLGNAWAGKGDLLVIEADESDGSLVRYAPWMGVLLNVQRDHQEPAELTANFRTFRGRVRGPFLLVEDAELLGPEADLAALRAGAVRFGLAEECDVRATEIDLGPETARFVAVARAAAPVGEEESASCLLPVPGLHNVRNAVAALAAARAAGVPLRRGAEALAGFAGVARRFQRIGRARGVEVVDDFAHNPEKIAAALRAAKLRARRVLAVYQPHGYGPTRFLREGLVAAFAQGLAADDRLHLLEIFYAGGTATRDISSRDLVSDLTARGVPAGFAPSREELVATLAAEAGPGDLVLVMGARDPSLTDLGRRILARLDGEEEAKT